jgi:hypothetical protein
MEVPLQLELEKNELKAVAAFCSCHYLEKHFRPDLVHLLLFPSLLLKKLFFLLSHQG